MRRINLNSFLLMLVLVLFSLSCTEDSITPITINEQVAIELRKDGFLAEVVGDELVLGQFQNLQDATIKINETFDKLGYTHLKFDMEEFANARIKEISCMSGPVYDGGDGYWCQNMLCIDTDTHPFAQDIYDFCSGNECYVMGTTCIDMNNEN